MISLAEEGNGTVNEYLVQIRAMLDAALSDLAEVQDHCPEECAETLAMVEGEMREMLRIAGEHLK